MEGWHPYHKEKQPGTNQHDTGVLIELAGTFPTSYPYHKEKQPGTIQHDMHKFL
jgi:hypothetical protein